MTSNFQVLTRDSEFFGFKVARISDDHFNLDGLAFDNELKKLFDEEVELAYYYSNTPIPENLSSIYYDYKLVDEKITLIKTLDETSVIHPNITLYDQQYPEKGLIALAQLAGQHTRFYRDTNISRKKYNELFKNWIIESVKGIMASQVIVYKMDSKIVGFATIKKGIGLPHIPLLAVNPEFEGRAIAFRLLYAVERILIDEGFEFVSGAAHSKNVKAVAVYDRYGSKKQKIEYGYHFWKKQVNE